MAGSPAAAVGGSRSVGLGEPGFEQGEGVRIGDRVLFGSYASSRYALSRNGAIATAEASFSAAYGYDVRGEVFMNKSDFVALNAERAAAGEETYKNPRNFTGGSLKLLDARECARRPLNILLYELVDGAMRKRAVFNSQGQPVATIEVRRSGGTFEISAEIPDAVAWNVQLMNIPRLEHADGGTIEHSAAGVAIAAAPGSRHMRLRAG